MSIIVRPARATDVKAVRLIIDQYALQRRLLSKDTVKLYEDVQEFFVAESDGEVIGCGALHVLWEDLGEVRTVAVNQEYRRKRVGNQILEAITNRAISLGLKRLFCLTFETEFFAQHGFKVIEGTPVEPMSINSYCAPMMKVLLSF